MSDILLLGPGHSRHRWSAPDFSMNGPDQLVVVDNDPTVRDSWPDAVFHRMDLRHVGTHAWFDGQFPVKPDTFDAVHAYEVLNLLPGNEFEFFGFWRELWRVMKPGALLVATVPHWMSEFIHAYPAPQRTYTPYLLSYLDPEVKVLAKSDFSNLWPAPHRFVLDLGLESERREAFIFRLRKDRI